MILIPTILCGGAGSRLWPVSRELHPKPFIKLNDGQSLLQKAFLRAMSLEDVDEILAITNREFYFKIQDELQPIKKDDITYSYILEHTGKNTAAAIAIAALTVQKKYKDALLLILTADHLINDNNAFIEATQRAVEQALSNKIVTFGITPSKPETQYGYIEAQDGKVIKFIEKPDVDTAKQLVQSGKYLWNSGMFVFKTSVILAEMQKYCPEILKRSQKTLQQSEVISGNKHSQITLNPELFNKVPDKSIDYAVMEKSSEISVIACDLKWSDVGSWNSFAQFTQQDEAGNSVSGDTMLYNVSNCHIQSEHRLVGAVGVENLIIIETSDALLVANKDNAQDVKHIFNKLKQRGHEAHKLHRTVSRPWGSYTVVEQGERFKIKCIEVKPKASLSLQMHHHRSEHWVVVNGRAKVTNNEQTYFVNTNESTYIPQGNKHRLENPGIVPLIIIEVQSGEYLGEDDIIRFADNYGRSAVDKCTT